MGRIKKSENLAPVNWEEAKKNNHMREYLFSVFKLMLSGDHLIGQKRHLDVEHSFFLAARGYRKSSKLGPTMKARKMEQEQNED